MSTRRALLRIFVAVAFYWRGSAAFSVSGSAAVAPPGFAPHNFGPASLRDDVLYSAERPGEPPGESDQVSDDAVREWIDFVRARGVGHILCLLEDDELAVYSDLPALYRRGGLQLTRQSMADPGAAGRVLRLLRDCEARGERVVTHCTGGVGRCGRVCAAWLCARYGLSPEDATAETLDCARAHSVKRAGDVERLRQWLQASGL